MPGEPYTKTAHITALLGCVVVFLVVAHPAYAALSCSVATSCSSGTIVFRMSSTTNAHAEVPSQSNYSQLVCCTGVSNLSNTCSGTYAVAAKLSASSNAHVEQNSQSNYGNEVCLSVPSTGGITLGYQSGSCSGFDTTVASMSGTTNAHVGDASAYTAKICASASATGAGGVHYIGPSTSTPAPTPSVSPTTTPTPTPTTTTPISIPTKITVPGPVCPTTSSSIILFTRSISLGTQGNDVRQLQKFLNAHGFPLATAGPGSSGFETTYYGRLTQMAMQQFQVAEGIVQRSGSESGIFGPKTRARVNEILISSETTSDIGCPPVAPTAVFQFTRTLPPGARSEDVRQLQQFLNLHGFPLAATGPGSFGHETVVYGFLTLDAVQRFQIEEHIVATPADPGHGLFGPRTRARANALLRGEK